MRMLWPIYRVGENYINDHSKFTICIYTGAVGPLGRWAVVLVQVYDPAGFESGSGRMERLSDVHV